MSYLDTWYSQQAQRSQASDATGRTELEQQQFELARLSALAAAWRSMMAASRSGNVSLLAPNNLNRGVVSGWTPQAILDRWAATHRPGYTLTAYLSNTFWGGAPYYLDMMLWQPPQAATYPVTQDVGLTSWWVVSSLEAGMAQRRARIAALTRVGVGARGAFVAPASKNGAAAADPWAAMRGWGSGASSADPAERGGVRAGGQLVDPTADAGRLSGGITGGTTSSGSGDNLPRGRLVDSAVARSTGTPGGAGNVIDLAGRLTGGSKLGGFKGLDDSIVRRILPVKRTVSPGTDLPPVYPGGSKDFKENGLTVLDRGPVTPGDFAPILITPPPSAGLAGPAAATALGDFLWANPSETARRLVASVPAATLRGASSMEAWFDLIAGVWQAELVEATTQGNEAALEYCLWQSRPSTASADVEPWLRTIRTLTLDALNGGGAIAPTPYGTTKASGGSATPWIVGGSLALSLAAWALSRRKRRKRR